MLPQGMQSESVLPGPGWGAGVSIAQKYFYKVKVKNVHFNANLKRAGY